ncbi:MAG TPA: hypothetical protein VGT44_09315 [Ktedonobacteraceae bacterium]|nr:hypothetical protein [Ktedonobacteraceae bacterium]
MSNGSDVPTHVSALYPPARRRLPPQQQRNRHAPDEPPPSRTFIPGGVQPEDAPYTTGERLHWSAQRSFPAQTTAQRGSPFTPEMDAAYEEAVRHGDLFPDDWAGKDGRGRRRDTTSAVRSDTTTSRPSSSPPDSAPMRAPRRPSPSPWKRALLVGMLAMGALTVSANAGYSWWQGVQADWSYGYPRVYQTDAVVGHHHDSAAHPSHFLVLNLHGQVDIIELPAGDPSQALIYTGPALTGAEADTEVVTVSFQDVNHDGRPDLVLHVGATEMVLLNGTDGKFHQPSQQQGQ